MRTLERHFLRSHIWCGSGGGGGGGGGAVVVDTSRHPARSNEIAQLVRADVGSFFRVAFISSVSRTRQR